MCSMLHMTPDIVVCYRLTSVCVFLPYLHVLSLLVLPAVIVVFLCAAVKFSSTAAKATATTTSSASCSLSAHCSLPAAAAQSAAAACATFEVLQVVKTFHVRKFCAHDLTS